MNEPESVVETAAVQTVAGTTPALPIANDQQPIARGTPREGAGQQPAANSQEPVTDLGKVRELVLKAHPDIVPDLVAGSSVDELIASVEPARNAYQRIADQVRESRSREGAQSSSRAARDDSSTPRLHDSSTPLVVQPPTVPAGGGTNLTDPGDLGPTTKMAQALAARGKRG